MAASVPAPIIFLEGPSSSGKSTVAASLQSLLPAAFWHYSIDHLRSARVLPWARIESGEFPWSELRESFFDGFHRSIPALATAGNSLIVEHIVETEVWLRNLARLLNGFDVFLVRLNCPLAELERREQSRGDRRPGEARRDFATRIPNLVFDFKVDSTKPAEENALSVWEAWRGRSGPSAFARMQGAFA